jgi:hypothetical protein
MVLIFLLRTIPGGVSTLVLPVSRVPLHLERRLLPLLQRQRAHRGNVLGRLAEDPDLRGLAQLDEAVELIYDMLVAELFQQRLTRLVQDLTEGTRDH